MSSAPFRFVHSGDFHFERAMHGLAEVPDHLRDALIDAPFTAAERVFDAALAEPVDFVILAGDLLDPRQAGPRAIVFLVEQFERLAEREISIYWAGGSVDRPDRWPSAVALPDNVHVFPKGKVEEVTQFRDGQPLATVMGLSCPGRKKIRTADFRVDPTDRFTVAVAYGAVDAAAAARRKSDYWALGGRHERATLAGPPQTVHYCGTPQGRSPGEAGPHGCTLVEVDGEGQVRTQLIAADPVRWIDERIELPASATQDELRRLLSDRMQGLVESSPQRHSLVSISIAGGGPAVALRRGGLADELAASLRKEFGQLSPAAWTVSLSKDSPADAPSAWYEEETILGDFLRAVRDLKENDDDIDLQPFLSPRHEAGTVSSMVSLNNKTQRAAVLRDVALLGVDLLRREELPPADRAAAKRSSDSLETMT